MGITKNDKIFILICFLVYFIWAISFPFDSAPDENARYLVPLYIYDHHSLPNSGTLETMIPLWGFSYAAYPYLMSIFSSVFMFIVGIFNDSSTALYIAARMSSVIVATINAFYAIKLSKIIFKSKQTQIVSTIIISLLPQIVYLSSYHNNDILGLCMTTAIIYYWFEGIQTRWSIKTCIPFGICLGICLLSYYNAYGVLLASLFVYFGSFIIKNKEWQFSFKDIVIRTGILGIIIIVIAGWWFIFAYLNNNGDFLGLEITKQYGNMYAVDFLKPMNKNFPLKDGISLFEMLIDNEWIKSTYYSLIGIFSHMSILLPEYIYIIILVVFCLSVIGCIMNIKKNKDNVFSKMNIIYIFSCAIVVVVPIVLSIYRSYTFDFQAQGRYIITIIPVVALIFGIGLGTMDRYIRKFKFIKNLNLEFLFSVFLVVIMIYSYFLICQSIF